MQSSLNWFVAFLMVALCWGAVSADGFVFADENASHDSQASKSAQRNFELSYGATLDGVKAGAKVQVWFPVPTSTTTQQVISTTRDLPVNFLETTEPKYGNRMVYFEMTATDKPIKFSSLYHLVRHEIAYPIKEPQSAFANDQVFLGPNKLVPVDGKPLELLESLELDSKRDKKASQLYEKVFDYMAYDKSKPGYGKGDSVWACDSRTGNCTDFHSLFISLARSQKIPSRFEIGFPIPAQRGAGQIKGYHCWAFFKNSAQEWTPVDISEADKNPSKKDYFFGSLDENRISFTVGRDIDLVPKQSGAPLNYFVYPYVEVDGKPLGKEGIKLDLGYRDLESSKK